MSEIEYTFAVRIVETSTRELRVRATSHAKARALAERLRTMRTPEYVHAPRIEPTRTAFGAELVSARPSDLHGIPSSVQWESTIGELKVSE